MAKRDLHALLHAKTGRKGGPRKGQSLPHIPPTTPAVGAATPEPPSWWTNRPLPKTKVDNTEGDEMSPRTELHQEIAKHTAALEEEKRLRAELKKVVAEREAL